MSIAFHLHGPSPDPALCSGNVGLRLRSAGPYDRLRSYPLDAGDRSDGLILESVHPDIGGVVHHRGHRRLNSCRAGAGNRPRSCGTFPNAASSPDFRYLAAFHMLSLSTRNSF